MQKFYIVYLDNHVTVGVLETAPHLAARKAEAAYPGARVLGLVEKGRVDLP